MPDVVSGGGVDGCGAVPRGEVGLVREPGDVTNLDEEPGRTGGADAVQIEQSGSRLRQQFGELLVGGFLAGIDPLEVTDQLGSHPASGLADGIAGTDLGEQRLGLSGGKVLLRPAGDQFQQQHHPATGRLRRSSHPPAAEACTTENQPLPLAISVQQCDSGGLGLSCRCLNRNGQPCW